MDILILLIAYSLAIVYCFIKVQYLDQKITTFNNQVERTDEIIRDLTVIVFPIAFKLIAEKAIEEEDYRTASQCKKLLEELQLYSEKLKSKNK